MGWVCDTGLLGADVRCYLLGTVENARAMAVTCRCPRRRPLLSAVPPALMIDAWRIDLLEVGWVCDTGLLGAW